MERHGMMLSNSEANDLIDQIKTQRAEFVSWADGDGYRAFYRVKIGGSDFFILYDVEMDCLVTIYHRGWATKRGWI